MHKALNGFVKRKKIIKIYSTRDVQLCFEGCSHSQHPFSNEIHQVALKSKKEICWIMKTGVLLKKYTEKDTTVLFVLANSRPVSFQSSFIRWKCFFEIILKTVCVWIKEKLCLFKLGGFISMCVSSGNCSPFFSSSSSAVEQCKELRSWSWFNWCVLTSWISKFSNLFEFSFTVYFFMYDVSCSGDKKNKAFADAGPPVYDCPVSAGWREGWESDSKASAHSVTVVCAFLVRGGYLYK